MIESLLGFDNMSVMKKLELITENWLKTEPGSSYI